MNTFGVERRFVRTAAIRARIGVRGPLIAVAACAVFASSYAISGSSATTGAKAQPAPNLPEATVTALVPASLNAAAPIPVVEVPRPRPAPQPSPPAAKAPAASAPAREAPEALSSSPAPAASTPEPAPAPAPAPSRSSSGGGSGHSPSSGGASGGTFESSG